MTLARKHQQLPGRLEALRLVLRAGTANAPADLMHLAGMGKEKRPLPSGAQIPQGLTFSSGADKYPNEERAAWPF